MKKPKKQAGSDWVPCRCKIIDPDGLTLRPKGGKKPYLVARTPPESKPHVGKKGFAEEIKGRIRITLDDGTTLWGSECWWIKLEKGE